MAPDQTPASGMVGARAAEPAENRHHNAGRATELLLAGEMKARRLADQPTACGRRSGAFGLALVAERFPATRHVRVSRRRPGSRSWPPTSPRRVNLCREVPHRVASLPVDAHPSGQRPRPVGDGVTWR